jgi:hypothetical protein
MAKGSDEAKGDPVNKRPNTRKAQIVSIIETAMTKMMIFLVQRNSGKSSLY